MNAPGFNEEQLEKMKNKAGFVAALDQSGGSTPKALAAYGIKEGSWSNEDEMLAIVHRMRARIMTSPSFNGDLILGAILFENTMDREVHAHAAADYLWTTKRIVPFLKVDNGLAEEKNGVRLMKPMPQLAALLKKAKAKGIFGTKMRSVINRVNLAGIRDIVDQQFELAERILAEGLLPIIEPEVNIYCPEKARAEAFLKIFLLEKLDRLNSGQLVFLKLTLPEEDNWCADFVMHPKVMRVLALSGGYLRDEANARLRRHDGVVASFSRALVEGLTAQQSDAEFNARLDGAVQAIFDASTVKQESKHQTKTWILPHKSTRPNLMPQVKGS